VRRTEQKHCLHLIIIRCLLITTVSTRN